MKRSGTLQSRIVFYFCGYMAFLLLIYTAGISGMLKMSEDWAFNRQLIQVAERILDHFEEHGEIPKRLPMHITAYDDIFYVPESLKKFVINHPPGTFEVDEEIDYHAAIVKVPSTGRKLFVFFNVESLEATEGFQSKIIVAVAGIGTLVFFLGWGIAISLSNRILNPISELAGVVQSLSLDGKDSAELQSFKTEDEIGTLAEKISQLLKRIAEFTRREREFTSHASHELRTPISIIKNAVEVLNRRIRDEEQSIQTPLARIERSAKDIEALINTFLMMARQGLHPEKSEACDLKEIAESVVEDNRYLLDSKNVEVELEILKQMSVKAPPSIVKIVLGNIVRNAFQYTAKGKIQISVFGDRISVCDSGPGINDFDNRTGIGLTIVKRLCQSMNWQFVITSAPGGGTNAKLIFSSCASNSLERKKTDDF